MATDRPPTQPVAPQLPVCAMAGLRVTDCEAPRLQEAVGEFEAVPVCVAVLEGVETDVGVLEAVPDTGGVLEGVDDAAGDRVGVDEGVPPGVDEGDGGAT